jgi:hypothetical protein
LPVDGASSELDIGVDGIEIATELPANPTTSVSVMVRAGLRKVSPALSSSRYFACIVFLMVVRDGCAPSLEAASG